jgi:hypothetical protein
MFCSYVCGIKCSQSRRHFGQAMTTDADDILIVSNPSKSFCGCRLLLLFFVSPTLILNSFNEFQHKRWILTMASIIIYFLLFKWMWSFCNIFRDQHSPESHTNGAKMLQYLFFILVVSWCVYHPVTMKNVQCLRYFCCFIYY